MTVSISESPNLTLNRHAIPRPLAFPVVPEEHWHLVHVLVDQLMGGRVGEGGVGR